jgi:hypothetical protein
MSAVVAWLGRVIAIQERRPHRFGVCLGLVVFTGVVRWLLEWILSHRPLQNVSDTVLVVVSFYLLVPGTTAQNCAIASGVPVLTRHQSLNGGNARPTMKFLDRKYGCLVAELPKAATGKIQEYVLRGRHPAALPPGLAFTSLARRYPHPA